MSTGRLGWYLARLRRMSVGEMAWRAHDSAGHLAWKKRQVSAGSPLDVHAHRLGPPITATLPAGIAESIPGLARDDLVRAADKVLEGAMTILGVERTDLSDPDWFYDPVTQKRAPSDDYCFAIEHRSEDVTGNVKQIWELSRLHHLTLLSAAWKVTGKDAYAKATDEQLMSWWKQNPFLSGVNWTSGIEVGIRLISFVWIRRLLDGWYGAPGLFEENDLAVSQIRWHQEYLSKFRSRGSSANNHVIAEAAGQLVAACAFPWFTESSRWREESAALLQREMKLNTFPSGMNREQASDYHGFVLELGTLAAVEAEASGHPLDQETWILLASMADAGASVLDTSLHGPRQGDGDDGRALVIDDPEANRWSTLLATSAAIFGAADWWPPVAAGVTSTFVGSLAPPRGPVVRDTLKTRRAHFADAGMTLLRTGSVTEPEIWCRCDGGPHGFLSIAAHAHADALSVELRHGGVEILVDPGTYCYHGEEAFRRYFRSTIGHNTVELGGTDQSLSGGPFMWLRHARTTGPELAYDPDGNISRWSASHNGYESLGSCGTHRRTVSLEQAERRLEISDEISSSGPLAARMAFHLGPRVSCRLETNCARLSWVGSDGREYSAIMELPMELSWSVHRGELEPMLGWYSSSFGRIEPTTVVMGERARAKGKMELHTSIQFEEPAGVARSAPE